MKRYDFEQEIDGSCIVEDPYGEWVKYTDIEKMVIKLTQDKAWNSPTLKPVEGEECHIMLIDGQTKPAFMSDGKWVKLAGYPYNFDFNQADVIKWRYSDEAV